MKMRCNLAVAFFILLVIADTVFGFPRQPVLITQVEDKETLFERETRDVFSASGFGLDDPTGSGDYELFTTTSDISLSDNGTPPPIPAAKIGSLHILSTTTARFTNTSVTSKLVNKAHIGQETEFKVRLPDEAFITELFIEVDGQVYRSTVETKEKAQKIYDTARERGQTASQVKQTKSEKVNEFSVSINVAATSDVKCTLMYQQLLRRKKGYFTNKISIRPNQIIPDLKVNVYITEPQGLDEVRYWLAKDEEESNAIQEQDATITSSTKTHIQFHVSKEDQLAQSGRGIMGDFVIKYDVVHSFNGGKIEVVNGYFVHYFSPEGIQPVRKHVVFTIDESGSMSGTKIRQTREAMLTILDQLREGDTFNIVTFESSVRTWQSEKMVPVSSDSINEGKRYSRRLRSKSSTNFYGGLEAAVALLDAHHKSTDNQLLEKSLSMIIILSDGLPTSGVTNLNEIKSKTKDAINDRYSLFTLGFGNDVDDTFLEKLAGQNRGIFRKIHVDSDSSLQLAGFFDEVATPLALNIEFIYRHEEVHTNAITQTEFPTYFMGSEIVVAGKLADGINEITAEIILTGTAQGVLFGTLVNGSAQLTESTLLNRHVVGNFTQRLWAYLTIKELLRNRLVSDNDTQKDAFEKRALDLSLTYHFVTPLTSLVVVKPDGSNNTNGEAPPPPEPEPELLSIASRSSRKYSRTPGRITHSSSPPRGRMLQVGRMASSADSDPHFLLHAPNGNVTVCFNVMGKSGQIFNLLIDSGIGLNINARVQSAIPHPELLKNPRVLTLDFDKRTIFDQIAITTTQHEILVSSSGISLDNNLMVPWASDWVIEDGEFSLEIRKGVYLLVNISQDVQLIIMLHAVNAHHPGKSDYLGIYVVNGKGLSSAVHGLIGQFERSKMHLYQESIHEDTNLDRRGILRVNDRTVDVVHITRDVLLTGAVETCWFAADNGYGLIDGVYTDYLRDSLIA